MMGRRSTPLAALDHAFTKYRQKALYRIKQKVNAYTLINNNNNNEHEDEQNAKEPFTLEKVRGAFSVPSVLHSRKRQLRQRFVIKTNDWFATPLEYKSAVRAALFGVYFELNAEVPKSWGKNMRIFYKHSALGKFELTHGKGYGMTNLLNEMLADSGYLPDGYITLKFCFVEPRIH